MDLVKEAQALAKKAVEYDKSSFIDAAAYFYNQAASLLTEAAGDDNINGPIWLKKAHEYKSRADLISIPKTYKQMKHPEMVLLGQCRFLFSQALTTDESGDIELALKLYREAVEATVTALGKVTQRGLKEKLEIILKQAKERVEDIKKNINKRQPESPAGTLKNQEDRVPMQRVNSVNLTVSGKRQYTDSEKQVLLCSSKINNIEFVPFMAVDYGETFTYPIPFTDRDGLLRLAPKQLEVFHQWVRPSQLYENPCMVLGDHVDCFSIKQTIISDCSFVASLSVAALYERKFGKRLITNIIFPRKKNRQPIYNPSGKYMVKLMINGVQRKVIIDDRLPVNKKNQLLSSFSTRKGELWISLLEKAYMKVMGGYNFPGSNSNIDLHALTGWIPERILIQNEEEVFNAEATFRMLSQRLKRGDLLLTVATPEMTQTEADRAGLVSLHAYAVLDIRQIDGVKLFQLKNPWSHVRWKGNYSELDATHWDANLCQTLDYDPTKAAFFDNGVFWIDYKSVLHFFDVFYLNWNPNLFSYTFCLHQAWSAGIGPAKDCYTIGENPQFKLKVEPKIKTGATWILLTRHITDIEDFRYNKEYITVLVYTNGGKRVYYPYDPPPFLDGVRINSPHFLVKIDLDKTKSRTFTLVVSQYEKTTTIYYTLRAYSTCPFILEPIDDGFNYIKKITNGEWKGKTAGGCRNYPTYDDNPEYILQLKEAGNVCMDLKAPTQFRIGMDLYPEDSSSMKPKTTGPYRLGFVVLELEKMPAGRYILVPSTYKPKEEARFFLTVKSTSPIELNLRIP
ncbi:calpain-7-like isoform X2 [Cimex lectularius]|nr:calpain-7-like isoform X2 [Cimex lectularius]